MRNILLVVVDTLRPDHLGCYGYDRPVSPRLDDLAARGSLLTSLWSASNFTAPAFTSLFTGLYPHQHGVFDFMSRASGGVVRQVLENNRARTGAVVSFRFFSNLLSEVWNDITAVTDTRSFNYSKDLPPAVTEESLAWLEKNGKDGPFCLFTHYDGPHMPYRLPAEFAHSFDTVDPAAVDSDFRHLVFPQDKEEIGQTEEASMFRLINQVNWGRRKLNQETLQWMKDKYDASIRYNDEAIGNLLDGLKNLGLAEDTIVVVLSDHGEEFFEHGHLAHAGIHLYEEVVRTVGIIHDPAGPGNGQRVDVPLSQVDVWPTLLSLSGATDPPGDWLGRGFNSLLESDSPPVGTARIEETADVPPAPVFCHGQFKLAMRLGRHKLIVPKPSPVLGRGRRLRLWLKMLLQGELRDEVFDLADDPGETRNLAGDADLRRSLRSILAGHMAAEGPSFNPATDLAEEQRKKIEQEMKDLGYM
ncbi:MAG: sulfatase-like hydrolase/transferase [Gemmatimonadales bacterium]|nr:sulfatase-like hydrolase/transferase [Gemmatimonadales bacterium]